MKQGAQNDYKRRNDWAGMVICRKLFKEMKFKSIAQ